MIITLFIGFIFTLIGSLGKDLTYVVNYFIGEENMNQAEPALFGAEGKKLSTCFNGNGDILTILNDEGSINMNQLKSFDNLNDLIDEIKSAETQLNNLKGQCMTFKTMMSELSIRENFAGNFKAISSSSSQTIDLSDLLTALNTQISSNNVEYHFSCNTGTNCKTLKTDPLDSTMYSNTDTVQKIIKFQDLVTMAKSDSTNSFKHETEFIKTKFDQIIDDEKQTLTEFRGNIKRLTGVLDDYIGENGGFADFVNCKFIGSNVKVILKNLRKGVGNNFKSIADSLLLAGCSLAVAISFTILLALLMNASIDSIKKN